MPWQPGQKTGATYGHEWRKTRAEWAARHHPRHPCVRCGHLLGPMGPWLHLDHDDHDRRIVRGFSHGGPCPTCGVRCNVSAGARAAARVSNARRRNGVHRQHKRTTSVTTTTSTTSSATSTGRVCRFHGTACGSVHSQPWGASCQGTADQRCADACHREDRPSWCCLDVGDGA